MKNKYMTALITLLFCIAIFGQQTPALKNKLSGNDAKNEMELLKKKYGEQLRIFREPGRWNEKKFEGNREFVITEELCERWSNNNWVNDNKMNYSYDSKWNLIESQTFDWDTTWINIGKYIYTYSQQNRLDESIYSYWDKPNNIWKLSYKKNYSYNTDGILIEEILKDWDSNNSTWDNNTKYSYLIGTNETIKEKIEYHWTGTETNGWWKPWYKDMLSYINNLISENLILFARDDTTWENNQKETYSYNQKKQILELLIEQWSTQWNPGLKYTYLYDSLNNTIEKVREDWYIIGNYWVNVLKYIDYYDSSKKLIETVIQNVPVDQWVNCQKISYKYEQISDIKTLKSIDRKFINFKILPKAVYINIGIKNKDLILNIYNIKGRKIGTFDLEKNKNNGIFVNLENIKLQSNVIIFALYTNKMQLLARKRFVIIK